MPMDITQQKEQFSLAYVHAVASAAGYPVYIPRVDDQSIDIGIIGYEVGQFCEDPRLEIQAKCTASPTFINNHETLSFSLKRKNHNDLIKNATVPRILVVVVVPIDNGNWIQQSTEQLIMRYCGYWVSLAGDPPTDQENKTVHLPTHNVLCGDAIKTIMQLIADGGRP